MRENILVCISHPNHAERLIQRGKLLADAFGGNCTVLNVEQTRADELDFNHLQTKLLFQTLADKYGVKMVARYSEGKKISNVIVSITKEHDITQIVIGQAVQSKFEMVMKQPIINELFQQIDGVDVHVVEVNRDIYDPTNSWDRGIEGQLVKQGEEYHLTLDEKQAGAIDGIFFRELSTNFSNGYFVINQDEGYQVIPVRHGIVTAKTINEYKS